MTVRELLKTPPTHIKTVRTVTRRTIGFSSQGVWWHASMSILPDMEGKKTFWYLDSTGKLFYEFKPLEEAQSHDTHPHL